MEVQFIAYNKNPDYNNKSIDVSKKGGKDNTRQHMTHLRWIEQPPPRARPPQTAPACASAAPAPRWGR